MTAPLKYSYSTVVLDRQKFDRWLKTRQANGSRENAASIARKVGYGRSYLSQLLRGQEKYDVEISGRFIGSFLNRFGLEFDEMFSIVPAKTNGNHPQERFNDYREQKFFERQTGEKNIRNKFAA